MPRETLTTCAGILGILPRTAIRACWERARSHYRISRRDLRNALSRRDAFMLSNIRGLRPRRLSACAYEVRRIDSNAFRSRRRICALMRLDTPSNIYTWEIDGHGLHTPLIYSPDLFKSFFHIFASQIFWDIIDREFLPICGGQRLCEVIRPKLRRGWGKYRSFIGSGEALKWQKLQK